VAYVWFVFICLTWGASFILMKKGTLALSPVEIAAWRVIGGAVTIGLLCWWHQSRVMIRRGDWGWLLGIVLIGYAWPYALQPWLVAQYGSAFIGLTVSFVPLLTILVSIPVLGIYPTARQVFGVLGALICLGLLVMDGLRRSIPAVDLLLAGTVPFGYAMCNVCIRRWLSHVGSLPLTFQSLLASSVILFPLSLTAVGPQPTTRGDWLLALVSVGVLGVVGTGVATWLFNKLIHEQGPLFAGMVTNLVPIGAVLWGWADQEQVTAMQIAALIGIVVMVSVVQFGAARPPRR
jgi:drug/metabolite transporter (DMT)-like permease